MRAKKRQVRGRSVLGEVKYAQQNLAFGGIVHPKGWFCVADRNDPRSLQCNASLSRVYSGPLALAQQERPIRARDFLRVSNMLLKIKENA